MTSLDTLATFIEQRIADAEADLGPEAIGWNGMDATNRARGRVSALREVEQQLAEMAREVRDRSREFLAEIERPPRPNLWTEQWIGKDYLAEEKWQNLRDSGYDETELRRAGGDR